MLIQQDLKIQNFHELSEEVLSVIIENMKNYTQNHEWMDFFEKEIEEFEEEQDAIQDMAIALMESGSVDAVGYNSSVFEFVCRIVKDTLKKMDSDEVVELEITYYNEVEEDEEDEYEITTIISKDS